MNHFRHRFSLWTAALCLLLTVAISPASTRAQASSSETSGSDTAKKSKKKPKKDGAAALSATPADSGKKATAATNPASPEAEIAVAKASGKVWVNLDSGVYHKSGRWYGRTKNGKFMTEAEAKAAGYKGSQRD